MPAPPIGGHLVELASIMKVILFLPISTFILLSSMRLRQDCFRDWPTHCRSLSSSCCRLPLFVSASHYRATSRHLFSHLNNNRQTCLQDRAKRLVLWAPFSQKQNSTVFSTAVASCCPQMPPPLPAPTTERYHSNGFDVTDAVRLDR